MIVLKDSQMHPFLDDTSSTNAHNEASTRQLEFLFAIARGVSTVVFVSTVSFALLLVVMAKSVAVDIAQSQGLGTVIAICWCTFGIAWWRWGVSGWVLLGAMDM